jgi:hypothetical protein
MYKIKKRYFSSINFLKSSTLNLAFINVMLLFLYSYVRKGIHEQYGLQLIGIVKELIGPDLSLK